MLFVVLLVLILVGPIVWIVVQSIRHPAYDGLSRNDAAEESTDVRTLTEIDRVQTGHTRVFHR